MSVRVPVGVVGRHHGVELPVRRADVEDLPGAARGQHGGVQASARRRPRWAGTWRSCSSRWACRRACSTSCTAPAPNVGWPIVQHAGRRRGVVHRLERGRDEDRRRGRAARQARLARDGRQERRHRAGRRGRLAGGERGGVGRVRHHRPALHGHEPRDRARARARRAGEAGGRSARRRSSWATGSRTASRWARSSTRGSSSA